METYQTRVYAEGEVFFTLLALRGEGVGEDGDAAAAFSVSMVE